MLTTAPIPPRLRATLFRVGNGAGLSNERIQQCIGAPIDMVSTGPDRDHTILIRHPYEP